jgi:hypothetical protein
MASIPRAVDLAREITEAGQVTRPAELAALRGLLGDLSTTPVASAAFLEALGAQDLLEVTVSAALLVPDDGTGDDRQWRAAVGDLQRTLATVLACGTREVGDPGQVGESWVTDLKRVGRERLALDQAPLLDVHGYCAVGVLLSHGEYSADFLNDVGGDILHLERTGDGQQGGSRFWSTSSGMGGTPPALNHTGNAAGDGYDPVVGLLTAVGRDPAVAKAFFTADQDAQKRLGRVDYLVTDRNWDGSSWNPTDTTAVKALGTALKAATCVGPQDPDSWKIVGSIVREIDLDEQRHGYPNGEPDADPSLLFANNDLVNPALRQDLGTILSTHIDSVHSAYVKESGPDLNHAELDPGALERVLSEVAKNPEANRELYAATVARTAQLYDTSLREHGWKGSGFLASYNSSTANILWSLDRGAVFAGIKNEINEENAVDPTTVDTAFAAAGGVLNFATTRLLPGSELAQQLFDTGGGIMLDRTSEQTKDSLATDRTGAMENLLTNQNRNSRDVLEGLLDAALVQHTPHEVLQDAAMVDPTGAWKARSGWDATNVAKWETYLDENDPSGSLQSLRSGVRNNYPDREYLPFGLEQYRRSTP